MQLLLNLFISLFILSGCSNGKSENNEGTSHSVKRDYSITYQTSFNNLFLDSATLANYLDKKKFGSKHDRRNFERFYIERNYEYAWFDSTGLDEQAHNFMNLQNNYILSVKDSSLYNAELQRNFDKISQKGFDPVKNKDLVVKTELDLTHQFFRYAERVYEGSEINTYQMGWYIPRKKVNVREALDALIENGGIKPHEYEPLNSRYKTLQASLIKYNELERLPWPYLTIKQRVLRKGDTSRSLIPIKERLKILGDLPTYAPADSIFEFRTEEAVRTFQSRHGIDPDGVIGPKTMAELNTPIKEKIERLLINLERARWMPEDPKSDFLVVNIPEFALHVYEKGKHAFSMDVIVGTEVNNTVIFSDIMEYVVFSPYWNIPKSITTKEILPLVARSSNYLSRNDMEIVGYQGGVPVIRQRPGPLNPLGNVKFLFPNKFNIYLHDTPFKHKFNFHHRTFSHGCIRLSDAPRLASFILRNEGGWDESKISSAMYSGTEKFVRLKNKVPVFITYFTAWVDENGKVNFGKDIYGHDSKMAAKLFSR